MEYCYLNGELIREADCKLHISDLQIQRGYGVFDFFRCRDGAIPWLEDYQKRLFTSIQLAGIENPLNQEEFQGIIHELQERNGGLRGAFKIIVTGGNSSTLEGVTGPATVIIMQVGWNPHPEGNFEKGVNLVSDEFVRPNPKIKSLYYFNSLRLRQKLKEHQAVDVLYHKGTVSECSRANLFWVQDGRFFTPASNILEGITRKQVMKLAGAVSLRDPDLNELLNADEVFITSTSRDITPVVNIDGRSIGKGIPGKQTLQLMQAFH